MRGGTELVIASTRSNDIEKELNLVLFTSFAYASISPMIFFSNRSEVDQIVSDESFFLIGPIVVLNRLQSSPFLTELTC